MPLPELVIAGAPKCGTTSLFNWLGEHPDICPAPTKETCYLMDRRSPLFMQERNWHDHGEQGYRDLFGHCTPSGKALEATPDYLYQDTARRVLADMESRPTVLFVLRRPADRVHSAWRFFSGHKAALPAGHDFATFVRHLQGGGTYSGPLAALMDNAIEYSRYSRHLLRWRRHLGRERMRLYLFEDMRRDPASFMDALCRDVRLAPGFYDGFDFQPHNVSYPVRWKTLHRLRNAMAPLLPEGRYRRVTSAAYRLLNRPSRGFRHPPGTSAALTELDALLAGEADVLETEFGLDTSPWRAPRVPESQP